MDQKQPPTIAIETVGCKLNQAESESLTRAFLQRGYRLAGPGDACDAFVLNTCTVTHVADRKALTRLRRARRQNPSAVVVATGCLAVRAPEEVRSIGGIDLVVGNAEKAALPEKIDGLLGIKPGATAPELPTQDLYSEPQGAGGAGNLPTFQPSNPRSWGRTRAMVKIQEGCSQSCGYCIVPRVRGQATSLDAGAILEQVKTLSGQGYREIVLTGSDIGTYKNKGTNLEGLARSILENTPLERLRLSSLQAQEITPGLLSLWRDPRLCRHVHLPLQSGSDSVLRAMSRRYSAERFRQAVAGLTTAAPEMAVTTDVIVGFPGETAADFERTETLCKDLGFARIHAFPYSVRPGTAAASLPAKVEAKARRERLARMLGLAAAGSQQFKGRFLGTVFPVLWERPVKGQEDVYSGLTDNYIRVFARSSRDLRNRIVPARLVEVRDGKMIGELLLSLDGRGLR